MKTERDTAAPRDENDLTAAELIAELIREERQRPDVPRSTGISIVISFDVKSAYTNEFLDTSVKMTK